MHEPRWQASLGVLAIVALYVTLPPRIAFGPLWLFPLVILILLVPLSVFAPHRSHESSLARAGSVALIAISTAFNVVSLILLIATLIGARGDGHHGLGNGVQLLKAGVQIWITNFIVFGLWFWELDAGGPEERAKAASASHFKNADFEFPQMVPGQDGMAYADQRWKPVFFDYVFLAFNTATALSPADTFPLTVTAKALMLAESAVSLVTIAIIVSRSINILA